jgi:hypothetical protein
MANQVLALTRAPDADGVVRSALLEAALGNMRALVEFLTFGASRKHDDMRAADYGGTRQQAPTDLHDTISGHLSHLSWVRVRTPPPVLPMVTTATTLLDLFKTFRDGLTTERQAWFAPAVDDAERALQQARAFAREPVAQNTAPDR